MPNLRLFLFFSLLLVGFMLWQQWQLDYGPRPQPEAVADQQSDPALPSPDEVPDSSSLSPDDSVPTAPGEVPAPQQEAEQPEDETIRVVTDVLDVEISTRGGSLVSARLLDYPVALKTPDEKVRLFSRQPENFYVAQSGLLSSSHQTPDHRQLFQAESSEYRLSEGSDELRVPLTWVGEDGLQVTKVYRFRRNSYEVTLEHQLDNGSSSSWVGTEYHQLQRTPPPEPQGSAFTNPERYSFKGAALYTPEERYEKFDFEEMAEEPVKREAAGGWAAMVQHYFLAAWVPPADEVNSYSTSTLRAGSAEARYLVRAISPTVQLAPGQQTEMQTLLFLGPKLQDHLDELAPGLDLTVDYGIFTPFSKVLFWILEKIHDLVGNWGWSIVLLTVLVKAAFFKLTEAQYKSMAKMRKLQPRIQALKERYGDDKQKFNQAMMEIYQKEKVNPLGGCLPLLIQIPVFIALYWVLLESVELRQASFMLWIQDLSSPDPYFILPIINGAAMFLTTKLSPNPAADPIQQKIMLAMPLVFSVMFAFFQSGLVLYWTVNSTLSLAQQWVITKRIEAQG